MQFSTLHLVGKKSLSFNFFYIQSVTDFPLLRCLYGQNYNLDLPIYGRNTRYIVLRTNSFGQQPIPYFPGKHGRIFPFIVGNCVNNWWGGNFRFWASYHAGLKTASLVIPGSIEKVPSITYLRIQFYNIVKEKKRDFVNTL